MIALWLAMQIPTEGTPNTEWLQKIARQVVQEFKIPGIWIGCADQGRFVGAVAAGTRKLGSSLDARLQDEFPIASVSKPVTATLIAILNRKGLVNYNVTVAQALPEIKDKLLPEFHDVELWRFLTHTSGVIRNPRDHPPVVPVRPNSTSARKQCAIDLMSAPKEFETGTKSAYSNGGYIIAGLMVESLLKTPLEKLAKEHLFDPLNLKTFAAGPPDIALATYPHPSKESSLKADLRARDWGWSYSPGGMYHCDITDLVRFGMDAAKGSTSDSKVLNGADYLRLTDKIENTATTVMGWTRLQYHHCYALGHNGQISGEVSELNVLPASQQVIAIYINTEPGPQPKDSQPKGPSAQAKAKEWVEDALRIKRGRPSRNRVDIQLTEFSPQEVKGEMQVYKALFTITGGWSGDLKCRVRSGRAEQSLNFYTGLPPGNHVLYWELPIQKATPMKLELDALGTSGAVNMNTIMWTLGQQRSQ